MIGGRIKLARESQRGLARRSLVEEWALAMLLFGNTRRIELILIRQCLLRFLRL